MPRGQSEAAYSLGLRRGAVLRLILVPPAVRIMLSTVISQLVVLTDSALFIVAYRSSCAAAAASTRTSAT